MFGTLCPVAIGVGALTTTQGSPAERILRLAAYLDEHRVDLTLSAITANVPGYDDGTVPRDHRGEILEGKDWETVRKKLNRDFKDLEESFGIVVDFDDANRCYEMQKPFFTQQERRALISAAAVVDVEGIDDDAAPVGELGTGVDEASRRVVLRVHAHVVALCDAIATRRAVAFRYHGSLRTLEPYAVGVWHNHWYVMGREREPDACRRYRLDRIDETADPDASVAIQSLDPADCFDIPDDFDRSEVVRLDPNDWGSDPLVRARIRANTDYVPSLQREFGGFVVERNADNAIVEVDVRHYVSFLNRLLGFREHALLIGPPVLIDILRSHLQQAAAGN